MSKRCSAKNRNGQRCGAWLDPQVPVNKSQVPLCDSVSATDCSRADRRGCVVVFTSHQEFACMAPVHTDEVYRAMLAVSFQKPERSTQEGRNSASVISPDAMANSRCRIAPLPQTFPSIFTL
jgi:hypothetical protein